MAISIPRNDSLRVNDLPPAAQRSAPVDLLSEAKAAYETKLIETSEPRAGVLVQLIKVILGRDVDRITFVPKCHEPVAIVDGYLFRGEASNPYDLQDGWLVVRTERNGWREVRSLAHLGEVAQRESLARVGTP